ncbi:hypothetical protein LCGC14_0341870 [marine sediment metagenome]|uniref:Uncharacterized protein n=1 Tax=marine sediment metagenome TaxID=412755 RepID=A0A0F9TD24_9ZZZZ
MRNEKINVLTVNEVNIASVLRMPYLAPTPGILSIGSDGLVVVSGASGSEVTAAAVLADNAIVRGDGGVRGIQDSLPTISDTGDLIIPDGGELQLGTGLDGRIYSLNDDLIIKNQTQDKDIIFNVNDGSVDTTLMTLNASDINVGIGKAPEVNYALDVFTNFKRAGSTVAIKAEVDYENDADVTAQSYGIISLVRYRGTASSTESKGQRAMDSSMFSYNTGTTNRIAGYRLDLRNLGPGTVTNATGLFIENYTNTGGGTIDNAQGLLIENHNVATNNYAARLELNTGGNNAWNVYASGTAPNYFKGNVGVNVVDPDVALEVLGSTGVKISFNATDNTTIVTDTNGYLTITPSGSRVIVAGDIEIGSADGFYYGDPVTDTSWREIRSGTKLSFQRRESSAWVEKGFFDTASFHSDAFHAEADAGIAGSYCWHPGTTPEANPDGPRLWIDGSGDLYLLEQNASPTTRVQNKIVRTDANGKVSFGISSPSSALHIKAGTPGAVGSHPAGQVIIQNPADDVTANVAITAYESDVSGDPDQQLWYLGSSTGSNSDITFLNRRDAALTLGTNDNVRITILGNGNVGIGTVPDNTFHVYSTSANVIKAERSSSTVDTVLRVLELHRRTTGTAASGIGAEMAFRVEDGGGGLETVAVIQGILTDVSETSEEGTLCFEVVSDSELIEALRIQGVSGGSAKIMANCSINAKDGFATELWDVAGSNFETAVVNTEYYSSNQHGGIYGTIYRQYFNTVLTSTNPRLDTGSRVTKMVDFVLHTKYTGNDRGLAHGNMTAYGSSDDHAYIMLSGASGGGNLSFSLTGYSIITGWVDYTK